MELTVVVEGEEVEEAVEGVEVELEVDEEPETTTGADPAALDDARTATRRLLQRRPPTGPQATT